MLGLLRLPVAVFGTGLQHLVAVVDQVVEGLQSLPGAKLLQRRRSSE